MEKTKEKINGHWYSLPKDYKSDVVGDFISLPGIVDLDSEPHKYSIGTILTINKNIDKRIKLK